MATPFIGEIKMFGGDFAPSGWALCDGQPLAISQNSGLFSLLSNTFGGDGMTTFGLPDMRGRIPIHVGTGPGLTPRIWGQTGGVENVTLTTAQIPGHGHSSANSASNREANRSNPVGAVPARTTTEAAYASAGTDTINATTGASGSGNGHNNLPPIQCVTFIIALTGIFPSET